MRKISFEKTYAKDIKALQKKRYSFDRLEMIIGEMQKMNGIMGGRFSDHALVGSWGGYRELHVERNVLLIYKLTDDEIIFVRLGTHDDLFK
jgi:mRNA interferase YafQ